MIDHVSVYVTDPAAAAALYAKALAPLGYEVIMSFPDATAPVAVGLGEKGKPDLWLIKGDPTQKQHVAIRAATRSLVRKFYDEALAAGARDNGAPGVRPYHPDYYGAFVLDVDGHNLEAVCHDPYLE
ncbi:MAG: VOC family protein [Myxococcales bacterium]|nr:VOC family protein [Myxococcales bacterium]